MRSVQISLLTALAALPAVVCSLAVAHAQSGSAGANATAQTDTERRKPATSTTSYPPYMDGGARPDYAAEAPPIVYLEQSEQPGTIIIDTNGRKLYFVLSGKRAYAYPISVGRVGFTWTGTERISQITSWPSWTPPPEMRKRQPGLPITVSGGVINPLGAKALYLGSTIYRIHGTNNARTIGRASSSGCFRMVNEHVVHLTTLARVGTPVRVVSAYAADVSPNAPLSSLFSGFGASDDAPPKRTKKN